MKMPVFLLVVAALFPGGTIPPATADRYEIDTLASGLQVPWDILFLPDGDMLFTERPGRVRLMHGEVLKETRPGKAYLPIKKQQHSPLIS